MGTLQIIPIGEVDRSWVEHLKAELQEYFKSVDISDPAHVELDYNSGGQVWAHKLLDQISQCPVPASNVLAIINEDITVKRTDYIFGLGTLGGKYALVSPYRLKECYYSRECREEVFYDRLLKEALHELGHTMGLTHCRNQECNMKFSSTVEEIDKKSLFFCSHCFTRTYGVPYEEEAKVYAANGDGKKSMMKFFIDRLTSFR